VHWLLCQQYNQRQMQCPYLCVLCPNAVIWSAVLTVSPAIHHSTVAPHLTKTSYHIISLCLPTVTSSFSWKNPPAQIERGRVGPTERSELFGGGKACCPYRELTTTTPTNNEYTVWVDSTSAEYLALQSVVLPTCVNHSSLRRRPSCCLKQCLLTISLLV